MEQEEGMIENMKSCEKCGNSEELDLLYTIQDHCEFYQGFCLSCGHKTEGAITVGDAVEVWNRRKG